LPCGSYVTKRQHRGQQKYRGLCLLAYLRLHQLAIDVSHDFFLCAGIEKPDYRHVSIHKVLNLFSICVLLIPFEFSSWSHTVAVSLPFVLSHRSAGRFSHRLLIIVSGAAFHAAMSYPSFASQAPAYDTYNHLGCITPPPNSELRRHSSTTFSSQASDAGHSVASSFAFSMPSTPDDMFDESPQSCARHLSQEPVTQARVAYPLLDDGNAFSDCAQVSNVIYPTGTLDPAIQLHHQAHGQWNVQQEASNHFNLDPSLRSTFVYASADRFDDNLPTPTPASSFSSHSNGAQVSQEGLAINLSLTYQPYHQMPQEVVSAHYSQQQQYVAPWDGHYTYALPQAHELGAVAPGTAVGDGSWAYHGRSSPDLADCSHVVKNEHVKQEDLSASSPGPARSPDRVTRRSGRGTTKQRSARSLRQASHTTLAYIAQEDLLTTEGNQFAFLPIEHSHARPHAINRVCTRDSAQHRCHQIDEQGRRCSKSFERLEHLNRHATMHLPIDQRQFPCPLPDCSQRISRSDNANQHFKTHLAGAAKGKRNNFCTWPVLKQCIIDSYEPKLAHRLIRNMEKDPHWKAEGACVPMPAPRA
jgi:hypothetical protein